MPVAIAYGPHTGYAGAIMSPMTVLADLEAFIDDRHYGELEVACSCGVVYGRWVRPEDAAVDLALEQLRAGN